MTAKGSLRLANGQAPVAPGTGSSTRPVAVIDVGSNSVRLVVFEALSRATTPIFNEKVLCGLGRGLAQTGRLNPEGRDAALATLNRFASLVQAMKADVIDVVATAAVREAKDGPDFVARVEAECGLKIQILSGTEEARLAAQGVLSSLPGADGLMADLGGGSLEVVRLEEGSLRDQATLPLGPLRTAAVGARALVRTIDGALGDLPWLKDARGGSFHAVGGAWRAIARVHMAQERYPLRIVHGYTLERAEAERVASFLSKLDADALEELDGVPRSRAGTLPFSALVLARLLKVVRPKVVVFCGHGLREGLIYDRLDAASRSLDPFIAAAQDSAWRTGRFSVHAEEIERWIAPLFEDADTEEARLRFAACLLSDSAWRWHPDYRAEQAFISILHAPYVGVSHAGRAFVATAVAARYGASLSEKWMTPARRLLPRPAVQTASALGAALDLANTLTGGTPGLLAEAPVRKRGKILELVLAGESRRLDGEAVRRRLDTLAREIRLEGRVRTE